MSEEAVSRRRFSTVCAHDTPCEGRGLEGVFRDGLRLAAACMACPAQVGEEISTRLEGLSPFEWDAHPYAGLN